MRIIVGSLAFFQCYKDFYSRDRDYLELVDNPTEFQWRYEQSLRGIDTFKYKKESAQDMIKRTIEFGDPILAGKFLVPEVAKAIEATVEDILPLEELLQKLDEKHKYQLVIFNAIKENNSFELTDEQRLKAYEVYKQSKHYT